MKNHESSDEEFNICNHYKTFLSKDLDVLLLRCAQLSGQLTSSQESYAMASIFSLLLFHFLETRSSPKKC